MAERPMKTLSGLPGATGVTYTFLQNDPTLSVDGKAADAKATGDKIAEVRNALDDAGVIDALLADTIPDTVQTITFDASGNVHTITHTRNNDAVRTDEFVTGEGTITETRTLATGESLAIVTDTDTLVTTTTCAGVTA